MKYNVHLHAVVRIKVTDIEAESQLEAIEKAEPFAGEFARDYLERYPLNNFPSVDHSAFAEEFVYALVDEEGDEEYERSRFYTCQTGDWELTRWELSSNG